MTKRLELTLSEKLYEKLEEYRKKKNFLDKQDIIYEMLRDKFEKKKTFFEKLKELFK